MSKPELTVYSGLYQDFAHLDSLGKGKVIFNPDDMTETNSILILHGGADISPSLYNKKAAPWTHADDYPSPRDKAEVALAQRAIALNIPIFGICRGAQLLTALAGGTLVQHVNGHAGGKHTITTKDNQLLTTTSAHHQMCNPFNIEHDLLAWSTLQRSDCYFGEEGQEEIQMPVEPEVIHYPQIRGLAIQGHPEWMSETSQFVQYCLSLTNKLLNRSL